MKKATLLALLAISMVAFSCKKEDPTPDYPDGNPLKLTNFARCDGSQIQSGKASYTIYGSLDDWKAGANAIVSGSANIPEDVVIPNLSDGKKYYYDLVIGDEDNWFGGNVFANSESNFSFTYQKTGNNAMVPKLFSGRNDLLGDFALSDVLSNGSSIFSTVDDCLKDNFITISKDFSMLLSEGATVCSGLGDATFQFYYTNCITGDPEALAEFESDWLDATGNQAIEFAIESGKSRLKLTVLENGSPVDYIYTRD